MPPKCPCGSGHEIERCCSEPILDPEFQYTREERDKALRKLDTLLKRSTMRKSMRHAKEVLLGDALGLGGEGAVRLLSHPNLVEGLTDFLYWDMEPWGEQSAGALLLEDTMFRLSPGERAFLRAGLESQWRLYEIVESHPGGGLVVQDLWTSRKVWVKEKSASAQLVCYDLVAARVMKKPEGPHEFEGSMLVFPREEKPGVLAAMHQVYDDAVAADPETSEVKFLKAMPPVLVQGWLRVYSARQALPGVQTVEGDELVFCTARYAVHERDALVRVLNYATDVLRDGEDEWSWIEPDGSSDRILGRLVLEGQTLVVEVHSRERMRRIEILLDRIAVGNLARIETTERDLTEVMAEQAATGHPDEPGHPPSDEMQHQRTKLEDEHYQNWLSEKIPALDGWTPKAAARDERMRPRLVEVLKTIENSSERARRSGQFGYDAAWLWKALGLQRPS